jgi:hypothetical protein
MLQETKEHGRDIIPVRLKDGTMFLKVWVGNDFSSSVLVFCSSNSIYSLLVFEEICCLTFCSLYRWMIC